VPRVEPTTLSIVEQADAVARDTARALLASPGPRRTAVEVPMSQER